MELQHFYILGNDMRRSTGLFISNQFVITFDNIGQLMRQVILRKLKEIRY